jgi:large subunit ribosomal protein L3
MKGFPATRGTHEYRRHAGSIGNRKFPGRVFKNKRMCGHMGSEGIMQIGLEVVQVRLEDNLLLVKGSIPGPKNSVVYVRTAIKG